MYKEHYSGLDLIILFCLPTFSCNAVPVLLVIDAVARPLVPEKHPAGGLTEPLKITEDFNEESFHTHF